MILKEYLVGGYISVSKIGGTLLMYVHEYLLYKLSKFVVFRFVNYDVDAMCWFVNLVVESVYCCCAAWLPNGPPNVAVAVDSHCYCLIQGCECIICGSCVAEG